EYDRLINLGPQKIRLRPAPHTRTPIVAYSLHIQPGDHLLHWPHGPHSNYVARVVFPDKVKSFRVVVDLVAEMTVINPFDFFLEPAAEQFPFEYEAELARDLAPFRGRLDCGPRFDEFLRSIPREARRTSDFL